MKKLSLKNLKLDGNDLLQREQLKNVFGGYGGNGGETQICILLSLSSGNTYVDGTDGFTAGEAGSQEANNFCVQLITNGTASSCGYDCEYDGIGQ